MSNLIPIADVEKMAVAVHSANLFGFKNKDQAFALMMIAQAEGKHPAKACQEYDIIQGRPALKSTAMLGRFQKAGGVVNWLKHEDDEVVGEFSHPQSCPTPIRISWDVKRATTAGLYGKDNWIKYTRQMLRARVIAEGVRATYPASCSGMYASEEQQDVVDVTPQPVAKLNSVAGVKAVLTNVKEEVIDVPAEVVEEQAAAVVSKEDLEPDVEMPCSEPCCSQCQAPLSAKVAKFSMEKIGRHLCFECQKEAK